MILDLLRRIVYARLVRILALQVLVGLTVAACGWAGVPEPPTPIPTAVPAVSPTHPPAETDVSTAAPAPTDTPTVSPPSGGTLTPGVDAADIPPAPEGGELVITWIAMADSQVGWAVGAVGDGIERILRSVDGGRSWSEVSPPAIPDLADVDSRVALHAGGPHTAWAVRYTPVDAGPREASYTVLVWRTRDGGETWPPSETLTLPFVGSRGDSPYLRFAGEGVGWLMARAGGAGMHRYPVSLLRSADGGATWIEMEDPREGTALQSCHKSGFAVGEDQVGLVSLDSCPVEGAEVRFTRDGAESWESVLLPPPESAPELFRDAGCESHSPSVLDRDSWRVAVDCRPFEEEAEPLAFLYSTEDAGANWSARSYPGGSLEFVSSDQVWALSRELYFSADGGQTWERRKQVFWEGQFSFVSAEEGWAVARQQDEIALVHTDDGGRSWEIIEPDYVPRE